MASELPQCSQTDFNMPWTTPSCVPRGRQLSKSRIFHSRLCLLLPQKRRRTCFSTAPRLWWAKYGPERSPLDKLRHLRAARHCWEDRHWLDMTGGWREQTPRKVSLVWWWQVKGRLQARYMLTHPDMATLKDTTMKNHFWSVRQLELQRLIDLVVTC